MPSLWETLSPLNGSDGNIPQKIMDRSTRLGELVGSLTTGQTIALVIATLFLLTSVTRPSKQIPGAPVLGRRWSWEPDIFLYWRYTGSARRIIGDGYKKFKDRPFVVKRHDVDYNVMPNKYLDELRLTPPNKLSSIRANVQNLGHKWTRTLHMTESNLHFRVVQNKLAAELPKYIEIIKTELDTIWSSEIPDPQDWQEVDIQEMMRRLAARMAATVFVGHPACRDEDWIRISVGYAMDVFMTGAILRMFPPFTHPLVAWLIPARYRVFDDLKTAKRILRPLMEKHKDAVTRRAAGQEVEEEDILLHWMQDHGTSYENTLENMAVRQLFITLAAVHTTSMTVSHILFDLCAHPEWFPVLREEIDTIRNELGPISSSPEASAKNWLQRLEKLDSFFVESQRSNLPSLFVPQRIAVQAMTLKDGTHIPQGTKLAWAAHNHMHDPDTTPDPSGFDPMRSYRKRHSSPELHNKHLAMSATRDSLAFGYGSQACPGRTFSVGEVKLILVRLLTDYEFEFTNNQKTRPANPYAGENSFPDPTVNLMMRRRKDKS